MKKIIILCFAFYPLLLFGQTDPQAKAYLDKTVALLQKKSITTDFVAVYENSVTNESEEKKGELKLKGNKFYLSMQDMELFFDGKTQWTYLKKVNEVSISEPDGQEMNQINPLRMVQEFRKTHRVQFSADDSKDKSSRVLNLFPNDLKADHFKVLLVVNGETNQIQSVKIFFKNGTSTSFKTKNYKVLETLDDSFFIFNKQNHPHVEINDLR